MTVKIWVRNEDGGLDGHVHVHVHVHVYVHVHVHVRGNEHLSDHRYWGFWEGDERGGRSRGEPSSPAQANLGEEGGRQGGVGPEPVAGLARLPGVQQGAWTGSNLGMMSEDV